MPKTKTVERTENLPFGPPIPIGVYPEGTKVTAVVNGMSLPDMEVVTFSGTFNKYVVKDSEGHEFSVSENLVKLDK